MKPKHALICAWCGSQTGWSSVPDSNSICPPCYSKLLGVPLLSKEEVSALPYGAIELDAAGTILSYNSAEAELSGRDSARVIGKNFFTQVAPCTAVSEFQGRFLEFLRSGQGPQSFSFTFPFPDRLVSVNICFISMGRETALVLVHAQPQGS